MEVTYTYYLDVYGGNMIPESRWQSLELKVRARLNHYTFNRMESGAWMAEAKAALCEMCEALFRKTKEAERHLKIRTVILLDMIHQSLLDRNCTILQKCICREQDLWI